MAWKRTVAIAAADTIGRRLGGALAPSAEQVAARTRVDPHWRRLEDGHAARLGTRETIQISRPVGRWRRIDPRLPQDAWRSLGKVGGLGLWTTAVGLAWWLGSSRGRGPLASVAELDRFGEALRPSGE